MESPPNLGIRTINMTPFVEGLIFDQNRCPKFSYGDKKVLGTQSHLTRGSTSTYCVPNINFIKENFNMSF